MSNPWLVRIAAAREIKPEEAGISTPQALAMGAAGIAPFGGLIGRKELIHDPLLRKTPGIAARNLEELQALANPGDILVTSRPTGSMWKHFVTPVTGSEFYHVQPVVGRRGGVPITASAGDIDLPDNVFLRDIQAKAKTIVDAMKKEGDPDVVLLRPKNMSPGQLEQFRRNALRRTTRGYDAPAGVKAWLNQIFVPKTEMLRNLGTQTVCDGNVCSTLPAQAFQEVTGRPIVPGVSSRSAMASDFLASPEYEQVAHHVNRGAYGSPRWRRWSPLASRAAIGATLAGGTYAVSEDPALAAGAIAAPAASAGAREAAKKYLGMRWADKYLLDPMTLGNRIMDAKKPLRERAMFAMKKGLPHLGLMAAGGALGYGAAKGVGGLLSSGADK